MLAFALAHYVGVVLVGAVACALAVFPTRRVVFRCSSEAWSIRFGLGLGILAHAVYGLGLLHSLHRSTVVAFGALGLGVTAWAERDVLRRLWVERHSVARRWVSLKRPSPRALGLFAVLLTFVAFAIPLLTVPLTPPRPSDATLYHLPAARLYIEQHNVTLIPHLRFSFMPQVQEMLFALALLFGDDVGAQLCQFAMFLATALTLYAWGRRMGSPWSGLFAAAAWIGTPVAIKWATVAYIDIGLTYFCLLACFTFSTWRETREPAWLLLSGAFAGFAATSKYSGLFFVASLGVLTVYHGFRDQRRASPLLYSAGCFVTAAPWYLYTLYQTGNPFTPFLTSVFGSPSYGGDTLQALSASLWTKLGVGTSLHDLVTLAWDVVHQTELYEEWRGGVPLFALLLPIGLLAGLIVRRLRGVTLITCGGVLVWFYQVQAIRYVLPLVPIMYFITSASLISILSRLTPRLKRLLLEPGGVALCAVLLFPGLWWVGGRSVFPTTPEERRAFLLAREPRFAAFDWFNHQPSGRTSLLYAWHPLEAMGYFCEGHCIGDWFGPLGYHQIVEPVAGDGPRLYENLRRLNVKYYAVVGGLPLDPSARARFNLVYRDSEVGIFELLPEPR